MPNWHSGSSWQIVFFLREVNEEILDNNNITGQLKEAFLKLPELFGSIDVIKSAKDLTDNKKALQSIERLEKLYSILEDYGVSKYAPVIASLLKNPPLVLPH